MNAIYHVKANKLNLKANKLNGVSTVDFHITAKCSQACPYCWGPRRFRNPVDTESAKRIIARIKELGVRRIVFTGGDPLQRPDALDLIRYAKETGLETALSATGDFLTPEILKGLSPFLDLISLPLDGSTETINSKTKHPGHFSAIMQSLDWLRAYPGIDVKVCTPVTRHNLSDIPAIAQLVEAYAQTTRARVFYNVFQAFPRAMFSVQWEKLIVSEDEFSQLKDQVGAKANIRINYLSHETLDKLYVMVFPDGSLTIPKGAEYLNFGPFLDVRDFDQVLNASQFDSAKHLRHSRGWAKGKMPIVEIPIASHFDLIDLYDQANICGERKKQTLDWR
ncbi:MAG: radical SAM protein [Anaerolineales bacterium]|jgi:MoaA/NifB/PqqE/SkfB family radical SAM enzyme